MVQHAFQIHDELGRVFHESTYRSALQHIFGSRAIQEFQICLEHGRFRKELYIDLVVDRGCPFELKSVTSLTAAHQSQLIQYLMLTDLSHGKLINFGKDRVEHQFVNTQARLEHRRSFEIDRIDWNGTGSMERLEKLVVALLNDWGTGLSRSVYQEAILVLAGGEEVCCRFTETFWQGSRVGRQPVLELQPGVAFEITCMKNDLEHYEMHLRRFLHSTALSSILWVNIKFGCLRLQRMERS